MFFADGTATHWPRWVTTATDCSFWDRRTKTVFAWSAGVSVEF
jgi:hypothetical protein